MAPPKRRGTSTSISAGDEDGSASVRVLKVPIRKKKICERQGEVKAINVLEPAMHHTSVLIDRWHRESVPLNTMRQRGTYRSKKIDLVCP